MRKLFTTLLILLSGLAIAQPQCGFDGAHAQMLQLDSVYKQKVEHSNARWTQMMQSNSNNLQLMSGYGTEYQIPLVVHVIHTGGAVGSQYNPSDASINAMIDYLNDTYEATYGSYPDTNSGGVRFPFKFVLAKRGPNCSSTTGINRVNGSSLSGYSLYGVKRSGANGVSDSAVKSLSLWENGEYYNIWIVNKIDSNDGTFGTYTAGYAYFPGASSSVDGTVMLAGTVAAGNITLPHEIGHAFNLYHTFQGDGTGSTCPTNTNCATQGDLICDTEPHKRSPFNCPSDPNPCTSSSYANVQKNFMDYSNCQDRFTVGQRTRVLDAMMNERSGLGSSSATLSTGSAPSVAATCIPTLNGANVNNPYGMGPQQVILNDLRSSSGGYNSDNYRVYIDRTCFQRANIIAGKSYTLSVKTDVNPQRVAVYIDTGNNGAFSANELVYSHVGSTSPEVHSTTYTVPVSGMPTCTPIRMRVLADFASSSAPTSCATLDYGQGEDFTVVVRPQSDTVTMFNTVTSGSNPTCPTGSVTFTASASKSISGASYQWYRNTQPVGTNSSTYTVSSLSAGTYYVQCKVKYTAVCYTDSMMTNVVALLVSGSTVTPSVSIAASPSGAICSGTNVTFTPTPTNGGTAPTYQWKVNGSNVGTGSTYSSTTLSNGDAVTCVMTSNEACASPTTATSNTINMNVTGTVTPSVVISSGSGTTICAGASVTFTATPTNGGSTPAYQWKVNGTNAGTNSNMFTTTSLTNGQTVTCVMTSNNSCASPSTATSNGLVMTVTATVTPSVSIAASPSGSICAGTSVTFTPTPTNGGTTPSYQWKVNGSNVSTGSTYTTTSLTNGQTMSCVMTSNAACPSPATATSNNVVMSVTSTVTPSVTISSGSGTSICAGASVTFTATPTNGGTTPAYQWKVNGTNAGTNSNMFTTTTLSNGDAVTCVLTSNATCASPTTATSNSINMTVTSTITPSVVIASGSGTSICTGASVTFTATPTNGGTTPAYQWKVNGSNVGTNSNTFTTSTLTNGQVVTCVMTSNAACASPTTATSNSINMTVGGTVTPSVSIASGSGTTICTGASVTFTATPTNGGTTPAYQWKVNGSNVGTNSNTFTTSTLTNGQVVTCVMTSNAACASPATATSNSINMTVNTSVTPSITIVSNKGNSICVGETVIFTATPTNGGSTPAYQWKVNGSNVGTNSNTYTTSALTNGQTVTCEMTSNATCASPTTATSAGITMTTTGSTASVAIASNIGTTVCGGDTVTFTATPTNGGSAPSYQWKVNGNNAGANSSTFKTTSLSNGAVVTCVMTSNSSCVVGGPATSNSLNMTVNPKLTPVIAVSLSPNDTICAGTQVTFTATITNGGTTPAYQWKVNGTNQGTNANTFVTSTLANGDVVTCVLTSSEVCVTSATATSTGITMTVNPILTPMVTTTVAPNDTICAGTSTTFSAATTNGGTTPMYEWRRNGVVVGTNSSTYNTTTLVNGDVILAILTTSEACISKNKDTSDAITMTVNPNLTPSITIVSTADTICAGTPVTFTATPTNGGTTPSYQWKVNGANAGTNNNTFIIGGLNDNDVVTCVLTSSETCVTSATATSNSITMTVNPIITPDVTLSVSPDDTICAGTMTTFTATPTNGGTTPVYQWQLNGVNAGTNSTTFSSATFDNGDVIRCIMTSNGVCLTKPADTSAGTTMTVIPNLTPAVVITHFPNDTICEGTGVTFTASPANEGATPTYQWQVNGTNAGTNSTVFSSTTLANGDMVRCILLSSITCVTKAADTSNVISVGVKTKVTPDVIISASPSDTACAGNNVTFTAVATDAGATPTYQWQKNSVDVGTNSATFMTSTLADGDVIRCIITTADTCVTKNKDTSNTITMTIKPIVTPDVTITVSPNDTVCNGDMVTFTATPVNGGATPAYQWRVNGLNAGTNSNMFATTTLADNDVVDVILTSSELCVTKSKDTSTGITITVKPILTPAVTTIVLPNDTVCAGTNVTFIATPVNGGTPPTYQWQVNGVNVGTNATSYSSTTLANNDAVRVIMTSSEMCLSKPADTSTAINMTINPNLTPDVTITVSPDDTICVGTSTTFTATPVNGGTTPTYQWRVNGVNAGTNSNTFVTTTLADNDVVDVILTSSEVCVTKAMDTSNAINMTVKPYLTPVVTTTVSPNDTICDGTSVTFTATPTDGGTTPIYQWQVNGTNVGTNSPMFTSSTFANNDIVRVIMTSSEMCLTKNSDTSEPDTMIVNPILTPTISITESPNDTVCAGTLVSFMATVTNEGATPTYQWKINGSNVGINANGYSSNSLVTGDVITCVLTSSEMCVSKSMDTSNAVTMTVNPLTTPSLVIAANTGTTSCVNGEVTFTATAFNGGTAQAYQWRVNGTDVAGANSTTYMTNTLANGDVVSCKLNITATCPDPDTAISNMLNMNMVVPSSSIDVLPNDTICDNQSAVFVVTGNNVGTNAVYQWTLNAIDQTGVTGGIFTMNTVGHQDMITTRFVSSDNCINAPSIPATNSITMTVNPSAAPTVGIAANPGTVLSGSDIVWFTSSVNSPNTTYQWRKNGVDIPGATGVVYTDLDPQDGDSISLWIKTNDSCRIPDTAISNVVVLSVGVGVKEVKTQLFDAVSIAPNPNNGTFTLKGTLSAGRTDEHVFVEVVNAVGTVIYREEVLVRNHELNTKIELGDKAHNGLHMVRITAEGRVHILKFIANR